MPRKPNSLRRYSVAPKVACPSCGGELKFQSSISVFTVCPYCRSMIVRHDLDLENLGTMAQLQEDASPLQLGTQGNYKGDRFTLIGRIRQAWSDGFWDEWFAIFESGKHGWLAEAQGFYMVSFEVEDPGNLPELKSLRPDAEVRIKTMIYEVDDIKEVSCEASEGELPFQSPSGRKSTSVDLSGPKKAFLNLFYDADGTHLSMGEYIDFQNLEFSSLKVIDGW
jgi:hypothetical protein